MADSSKPPVTQARRPAELSDLVSVEGKDVVEVEKKQSHFANFSNAARCALIISRLASRTRFFFSASVIGGSGFRAD